MTIEFSVDHDHTYAGEDGIEQLIGWITFSVGTYPGDFRVREQGSGTPRTINLPPRRGWLAADGHLYKDQTLAQPFRLVANNPAFNLLHLTYRADFDLTTILGDPVLVPHCYFPAPSNDTTLQLTKVMINPLQPVMEVRTKGYVEDIIDVSNVGESLLTAANATAARAAINADFFVNARDYGAIGDGSTNDTAALQNWANYIVANHRQGWLPNGTYKITSPLVFPHGYGWGIHGENSSFVTISQATNNTPILEIGDTDDASHTYTVEGLTLTYASAQSSSNTNAYCIVFSGKLTGDVSCTYFSKFRDIWFRNGYYALTTIADVFVPWGCEFDQLSMMDMSGGFLDYTDALPAPNNRWGRLTLFCNNAAGPIFKNWSENSASVAAIEFLEAHNGPVLIDTAAGFSADIGAIKLENGTYTGTGHPLIQFNSTHYVRVGDLNLTGNNVTIGTGHTFLSCGYGLGSDQSRAEINSLRVKATSLTGDCYAVLAPGSTPIGKITIGTVELENGWKLCGNAGTATANVLTVRSWINGAIIDVGDADYTVTPGCPNIIRFITPLTGPRTLTLPSATSDDLFNGLWYDIIFDGSLTGWGAYINSGVSTLTTQSTDRVKLRYTWHRSEWVLTALTNLTSTPTFTAIQLGHASDTTLSRSAAGVLAVEGVNVLVSGGALGTPSSGTLTSCSGLPVSGIAASTSTALGVGSVELGHASDTTLSRVSAGVIAVEGVNVLLSGGALGTPSSGTLTSCTGLPVAGITASTSTALGVGSIELGHATDTSITRSSAGVIAVEGVTVPLNSITSAHTAQQIELGHASDTTLSRSSAGVLAVEGVAVDTVSAANTLTNKRITKRIGTTTTSGTPSIDCGLYDQYNITALAAAITAVTISGTPTDGQELIVRIKDNGTARAITWGASFVGTLLTTTVISKTHHQRLVYDATATKWAGVYADTAGY